MLAQDEDEISKLKKKLKKLEKKNNEIRDEMAIQRTIFANERTLMAYLRTAIALVAGGFAALKLSQHHYMEMLGVILMPVGVALAVYSFVRYFRKQKLIKRHLKDYSSTSQHRAELHEKESSRYRNRDEGIAAG
jgi:putative membrane protein